MQHQLVQLHAMPVSPMPKYFCAHCDPSPNSYWFSYSSVEKVHANSSHPFAKKFKLGFLCSWIILYISLKGTRTLAVKSLGIAGGKKVSILCHRIGWMCVLQIFRYFQLCENASQENPWKYAVRCATSRKRSTMCNVPLLRSRFGQPFPATAYTICIVRCCCFQSDLLHTRVSGWNATKWCPSTIPVRSLSCNIWNWSWNQMALRWKARKFE